MTTRREATCCGEGLPSPREEGAVVVKPLKRQQPRSGYAEAKHAVNGMTL